MCFPGWTWEYIDDHMTVPRLSTFTEYWKSHPPMHLLVAAYLGVESPKENKKMSEADILELMNTVPQSTR